MRPRLEAGKTQDKTGEYERADENLKHRWEEKAQYTAEKLRVVQE